MTLLDYCTLVAYFALVVGLGFWHAKRAAAGLDSYFLGGKSIHWLHLRLFPADVPGLYPCLK